MRDFEGKVAFITGGASGIGLGIAGSLVDAGMKAVLADLREDHLEAALGHFAQRGQAGQVHALRLDVTDRAAMRAAAEETERVFGRVHVLCNNAGVGIEGPFQEVQYSDWDFGLGVNLGGVINRITTFLPRIRAHGEGGHIVNTASLAAFTTMPAHLAIYVTAKAGVVALSEAMNTELARQGIGVTVLCPGPVKSSIHELARNRPARFATSSAFEEAAAKLGERPISPLWMEPSEVGTMVREAIRHDRLYVITHGEWRALVQARNEAILAAMPTGINPDLIAALRQKR
jgi:NAD(P)-dependent dehydrogenase (short-subunit alcohol dehydrogenase family)